MKTENRIDCEVCGEKQINSGKQLCLREYSYYRCRDCGTLNLNVPTTYELTSIYTAENYFLSHYANYFNTLAIQMMNFKSYLRKISPYLKQSTPIAEIGCGSGAFLRVLLDAGYKNALGFEMNPIAADFCIQQGLTVRSMDDFYDYTDRFGMICMFDVIEHLRSPNASIRAILSKLESGGLLIVTTSINDSITAKLLGNRWWFLNPPDHCIIYSAASLQTLLSQNRLKIVKTSKLNMHFVNIHNVMKKAERSFEIRLNFLKNFVPQFNLPIFHFSDLMVVAQKET